jgi:hypothetical protein
MKRKEKIYTGLNFVIERNKTKDSQMCALQ